MWLKNFIWPHAHAKIRMIILYVFYVAKSELDQMGDSRKQYEARFLWTELGAVQIQLVYSNIYVLG